MNPIVTTLATGLDPLWNLQNVMMWYCGQFNRTQRLIQISVFLRFLWFSTKTV